MDQCRGIYRLFLLLYVVGVLALGDDCVSLERNIDEDTYNTMTLVCKLDPVCSLLPSDVLLMGRKPNGRTEMLMFCLKTSPFGCNRERRVHVIENVSENWNESVSIAFVLNTVDTDFVSYTCTMYATKATDNRVLSPEATYSDLKSRVNQGIGITNYNRNVYNTQEVMQTTSSVKNTGDKPVDCVTFERNIEEDTYNTISFVCKLNPGCGSYDSNIFLPTELIISGFKEDGSTDILIPCDTWKQRYGGHVQCRNSRGQWPQSVLYVTDDLNWDNTLNVTFTMDTMREHYVGYNCDIKVSYNGSWKWLEASYVDSNIYAKHLFGFTRSTTKYNRNEYNQTYIIQKYTIQTYTIQTYTIQTNKG